MTNRDGRFKDASWYEGSQRETILIGGMGGIGSNALYNLVKTIPAQYFIIDHDRVNEHNIGTQFYTELSIGKFKVEAVRQIMKEFSNDYRYRVNPLAEKIGVKYMPIGISAFDNMEARKEMFETWCRNSNREIFIDGRLRANLYEVYVVTPGREEEYRKTLFDDSGTDEGPCTFKQTAYFGMLIGARITHVLVNYLTNKYAEEEICNLPFKIQEVGEPFLIKTEYAEVDKKSRESTIPV